MWILGICRSKHQQRSLGSKSPNTDSSSDTNAVNYIYYRKAARGQQKCLSELGQDMKPAHRFTYFKTWIEAWRHLRAKHGGNVSEQGSLFRCEVTDAS